MMPTQCADDFDALDHRLLEQRDTPDPAGVPSIVAAAETAARRRSGQTMPGVGGPATYARFAMRPPWDFVIVSLLDVAR